MQRHWRQLLNMLRRWPQWPRWMLDARSRSRCTIPCKTGKTLNTIDAFNCQTLFRVGSVLHRGTYEECFTSRWILVYGIHTLFLSPLPSPSIPSHHTERPDRVLSPLPLSESTTLHSSRPGASGERCRQKRFRHPGRTTWSGGPQSRALLDSANSYAVSELTVASLAQTKTAPPSSKTCIQTASGTATQTPTLGPAPTFQSPSRA